MFPASRGIMVVDNNDNDNKDVDDTNSSTMAAAAAATAYDEKNVDFPTHVSCKQ